MAASALAQVECTMVTFIPSFDLLPLMSMVPAPSALQPYHAYRRNMGDFGKTWEVGRELGLEALLQFHTTRKRVPQKLSTTLQHTTKPNLNAVENSGGNDVIIAIQEDESDEEIAALLAAQEIY